MILFMVVLLLQSAYSMFFHGGSGIVGTGDIDIIVRTSSAAIFGYFLSRNFIRPSSPKRFIQNDDHISPLITGMETSENAQTDRPHNQIGFSSPTQSAELEHGDASGLPPEIPNAEEVSCNRLQVIVATCIGLFCLINLLLMRNVAQWNTDLVGSSSITATVAQFRDFVSSCVGFLIGCPTHPSGQMKS